MKDKPSVHSFRMLFAETTLFVGIQNPIPPPAGKALQRKRRQRIIGCQFQNLFPIAACCIHLAKLLRSQRRMGRFNERHLVAWRENLQRLRGL